VTARASHLADDRLFECYFAERRGEAPDPRLAEHLADCRRCSDRYADLTGFMVGLRDEADVDFEALFPPGRLQFQRGAIARRLEQVGHAARVLTFPSHVAASQLGRSTPRIATRWIAGAAAAGLFVGVAAGRFLDQSAREVSVAQIAAPRPTASVSRPAHLVSDAADSSGAPAMEADEHFMTDLEAVLDRPSTRELLPIDTLTPHVREVLDVR